MRHVPFIDLTGIRNLKEAILNLQDEGTQILLSGVQRGVLMEFQKYELDKLIGSEHIFSNFDAALQQANTLAE